MKQSTKRIYLACTAALRICFSAGADSAMPSKKAKTNPRAQSPSNRERLDDAIRPTRPAVIAK